MSRQGADNRHMPRVAADGGSRQRPKATPTSLDSIADGDGPRRQDEVEVIHGELRRRILHNELAAGARINQAVLARDLQVSRGPVREALRLLQREGLVDHVHQQQMRVSTVSLADLEQLYAMRISVEAFAAGLTVPTLTTNEIGALETALSQMDEQAAAGDIDRWEVVHGRFHAQLIAHAGDRIARQVRDFSEHCARYRRLYIQGEPRAFAQGAEEHRGIVEAVVARDPSLAAARLGVHLGRTALTVVAIVDPGYDPEMVRAAIRWVGANTGVQSGSPGAL
jgi:DNA-binding GntR family transcriptional regulator